MRVLADACISGQGVLTTIQTSDEGASALALLTPFKGTLARALEGVVLLAADCLRGHEPSIRARRFLHYAYWVRLPRRVFRREAPRSLSERYGALLFVGSFAGKVSDAAGFMRAHPLELDRIWERSAHFPGAAHYDDCLAFARRYERRPDVSFDAYDASVEEIRTALRTREALDRFDLEHAPDSDEDFVRALRDAVASSWGEP